jgi:hypothetical protein
MNKFVSILIFCFVMNSCTNSEAVILESLATYLENETFETGGVIACAASDEDTNEILTYYYPEEGATDIRYYESLGTQIDENDYSNYANIDLQHEAFFNGYLGIFVQNSTNEKWIIISYKIEELIKISNPIRSKQLSKPTVWNSDVDINQDTSGMPNFNWQDNAFGGNTIYFQVLSDAQNNLLSGTYTYENTFKFYDTSNVVLNITQQIPPSLIMGNSYNFTLMDVSEDNWVNLVSIKTFNAT